MLRLWDESDAKVHQANTGAGMTTEKIVTIAVGVVSGVGTAVTAIVGVLALCLPAKKKP